MSQCSTPMWKKCQIVTKSVNLLGVVAERILSIPQHFPGHECVKDGSPSQRHAEVKAKEPPVLYWFIKLQIKHDRGHSQTAVATLQNQKSVHHTCMYKVASFVTFPLCNWHSQVDLFVLPRRVTWRLFPYLHELRGLHGVKQTYPQMLVFIVHCYHIKANNLRHCQQNRNNPYQSYFDCCPHWDPNAFDSIPSYYSSVSAKSIRKYYGLGDFLSVTKINLFS